MKGRLAFVSALFVNTLLTTSVLATEAPQQQFFNSLKALCGQSFVGKVVSDVPDGDSFAGQALTMTVAKCNSTEIRIPFHVGEDTSRTWVIRYDDKQMTLKHEHRHKDGTLDELTNYGGVATSPGWAQVQSFPADQETKDLFVELGIPQSIGNTWHLYLYPERFSYRLTRQGRVFQVDFNLNGH